MLRQKFVECGFRFVGFAAASFNNQILEVWNLEWIDDLGAACADVGNRFGDRRLRLLVVGRVSGISACETDLAT
jgi:hypothetical protein